MTYTIIPVTRFSQNCTLLVCEDTKQAAVIDAGGDIDIILGEIAKAGATLEKIFITHAHLDHASASRELAKRTGAKIEGPHRGDDFLIEDLPGQCLKHGFPPIEQFTTDRWLEHGDTVTFGNETLEVLHCPGHTPGHVAYFHRASKLAAVGDILFVNSVGVTSMPYADHPTLVRSIRERLFPLGDRVKFIPGHGRTSTFGLEREFNPFVCDDLFI